MKGLYLFSFLLISVKGSSYKAITMYKVENSYTTLWSTSTAAVTYNETQTMSACARRCLRDEVLCGAVVYDPVNLTCSLGRCAITQPETRSSPGDLYQIPQLLCNSTPGFSVKTNGHTSACLWWSTVTRNFFDAMNDCKAKGSILVTFKNWEKFTLLNQETYAFWIGLDDIAVEGVYRWHDDGSVFEMPYGKQFFSSGEPNNDYNEDCMAMFGIRLNDYGCGRYIYYVCEKLCFSS